MIIIVFRVAKLLMNKIEYMRGRKRKGEEEKIRLRLSYLRIEND